MATFENWGSFDDEYEEEETLTPSEEGEKMMEAGEEVKKPDFLWSLLTSKINPIGMATRFAISPKKEIESELVEPIPIFRRFATKERTEEFMGLSEGDKRRALVMDGLEIGLIMTAPYLLHAYGKAGTVVGKKIIGGVEKLAPKFRPKMAALGAKSLAGFSKTFSYEEALGKRLRGRYKGIGDDEVAAVSTAIQDGGTESLTEVVLSRVANKQTSTQGFNKLVLSKGPLGSPVFREGLAEELTPVALRGKFYKERFREELKRLTYGKKEKPIGIEDAARFPEGAFQHQAVKFLGREEGRKLRMGEATEEMVTNFLADMVAHPEGVLKLRAPGAGTKWFTPTTPHRVTFGYGEVPFKTRSKVYLPGAKGFYDKRTQGSYEILTWQNMLHEAGGFYKVAPSLDKYGRLVTKPTKEYTPEIMEQGGKVLQRLDDLTQAALGKKNVGDVEALQREMAKTYTNLSEGNPLVKKFVETWRRFSDHLYGDRMKQKIPQLFEQSGLRMTGQGRRELTKFVDEGVTPVVDRVFYKSHIPGLGQPIDHVTKQKYVEGMLKLTRGKLDKMVAHGNMFTKTGKDLELGAKALREELTMLPSPSTQHKGWLGYLQNYLPRIGGRLNKQMDSWGKTLVGEPGFTNPRTATLGADVKFEERIVARINAQMNELYLHDTINDIVKYSKELPAGWRYHIDQWLGTAMGRPTASDLKWTPRVQKLPFMKGATVNDTIQLGRTINNLQYSAGLGFKPFSAKRNLFQPLINVPADLGGLRATEHLLRAFPRAFKPSHQKYIRDIGGITEYAPEIAARGEVSPWPRLMKVKVAGKSVSLPNIEAVRDAGMWMFRGADHFNRYWTGAAALNKWESGVKFLNLGDDFKRFVRKAGLHGRDPHIKDEIVDLLRSGEKGSTEAAKAAYVKDVIGDTQYLYGAIEAPPVISKWGAIGKTVTIYQSWWMNYGNLFGKWARPGDVPTKVGRVFNAMLSGALAAELMGTMWDRGRVASAVFLGPMPSELPTPPILHPIETMIKFVLAAANAPLLESSKATKRRRDALLNAPVTTIGKAIGLEASMLTPGGYQIRRSVKDVKEEGLGGLKKEIFQVHKRHKYGWKPITPIGKLALGFLRGGR